MMGHHERRRRIPSQVGLTAEAGQEPQITEGVKAIRYAAREILSLAWCAGSLDASIGTHIEREDGSLPGAGSTIDWEPDNSQHKASQRLY